MLSSVIHPAGDHLHLPSDGDTFFQAGGFTPWETHDETPFIFTPQEPVFSFSGSDNSTPKNHSSDEVDRNPEETNVVDDRKQRRMKSNRESARRSRMRKQKHLENLRNQVNRLKTGNRELTNRLKIVNLHGKHLRRENQILLSESVMLQRKLWAIRQELIVRQIHHQLQPSAWPCNNNVTSIYEQNPPSLIT